MTTTEQDIHSFAEFALGQIGRGGEDQSIEDLFDRWRLQHPPAEDALAIRASVRDMESGDTGRPFEQFADDFRTRNRSRAR